MRQTYAQDRADHEMAMRKLALDLRIIREIVQGDKLAHWQAGGPIFGNVYSEVLLDCMLKEASTTQHAKREAA